MPVEDVEMTEGEAAVAMDTEEKSPADEPEMSGSYTWVVDGWPRPVKSKVHSEKFEIGTYIWRLLVIPGNDNPQEHLSVFLDSPEAAYTPTHLSPRAKFKLVLESTLGPEGDHSKDSEHLFTSSQMDWGFNQFLPLTEVSDPARGFVHEGGKLRLRVEVTVRKDERLSWDSRKETGYVGLKNQGATCYMNSLLQCLYHLPYFRKAVYHMPTSESDDPARSMPLALQSVFYKLQYSRTPPSTKDLTKSFGWNTYDAFFQHDVQELNRVLCEKLDDKMKGTAVEKSINYLFEGHTESYVECKDVDVRSTKRESFMDIQLVVRGCRDVYESFDKYCEVEELVGENRYRTDSHGLQDARKGLLFESLPPVLQLHLRRFDYDYQRDTMLKLNDRYEFPEVLDLDRDAYLSRNADRGVRNLYKLHSVLVHSGGVHGGHYYAFIRPDGNTWYRFDDERVTKEDARAAVEEQYGGDDDAPPLGGGAVHGPFTPGAGGGGGFKLSKLSNAYMLVYVRVSQWDDVMCRVTKDDIPPYLRERLEVEQREKEARQRAKAEAHLYCSVRLARDADMAAQVGKDVWFDLVDYDRLPEAASLRVRKHTKFGELKGLVAEQLGIPVEKQRYWTWHKRQNNTIRLSDMVLGPDHDDKTLMDLRDHLGTDALATTTKHALMDLRLYLETPWPDPSVALHKPLRTDVLLFLKYYDPATESLRFVGHIFAPKAARMRDLFIALRRFANLPDNVPLACYEEIKWEPSVMVDPIAPTALLHANAQLEIGDIIAFQVAPPEGDGAPTYRFPTVRDFLTYVRNRMLVKFKKLESPDEEGFTLELLRGMDYDAITAALAERLGLEDANLLRLTSQNGFSQQPMRLPLKHRQTGDLARLLSHSNHLTDTFYYEVLDLPLPQLEALKTFKINFHDERTVLVGEPHTVRVVKDARVSDALEELRKRLPEEHASKRLRLLELLHSRIYKVVDPELEVSTIDNNYWTLRAEPLPEDEADLAVAGAGGGGGDGGTGDILVHVYHVAPDRQEQQQQQAAAAQQQQQQQQQQQAASGGGGGGGKGSKKQQQQQVQEADDSQQQDAGQQPTAVVPVLPFGEPFLLRIGRTEPLSAVKARIRTRLGVKPEAFEGWRFCFVPSGRALPEYLTDTDVPAERFAGPGASHALGAEAAFLGCEHEDRGPKRPSGHRTNYGFERAVKINS